MKKNGKWKFVSLLTLLLSFFVFAGSAVAAETQTVSINPSTATKTVGDPLSIAVDYAITNDAVSKGLSIRVHYNSKKLTFVNLTNVYATDKLGQVDSPQDDTIANLDGDANTDKQVNVTWTSFAVPSAWPGTPRTLFNANFTVNAGAYNGVTDIKLSNANPPVGITVVKNDLVLTIIGGKDAPATPVLSPATGFKKAAVNVTAVVDGAPIKSYYTLDGTDPTTASTEYTGAAFPVDGADKAKVTVKMISHDAGEGIYGSVGSVEYTFDKTNPTGTITAPAADAFVKSDSLNITGTAADTGGSGVDKVEVSIDGGTTWKAATGTATWTYAATLAKGANAIQARVTDKVGQTFIIVGSTITYYPPLALFIDSADVTGQTVNIPNTAGSNTKIITVTGGSEAYSTYTWLPAAKANVGALTAGASLDKKIYTAEVDKTGTHTITVTDPADATVFTADITFNVVDFSVTGPTFGYVGKALDFTAAGQTGSVTWTVKAGADVAGTPVISGTANANAKVTPLKAGTFDLSAKDEGTAVTFDVPQVTIYTVPDFTKLPAETVIVNPGAMSSKFEVSGGDDTSFVWAVAGPSVVAGGAGKNYTFPAPSAGNFAGDYTITVTEKGGYTKSFKVYVPLTINPTQTSFVLPATGAAQVFTVTGAADGTGYTTTVDSLDDAAADVVNTGLFAANSASFQFDPKGVGVTSTTGTKSYTLDFEAAGHTALPQIDVDVVPVVTYAGVITDSDGGALSGATVTLTSPAKYAGTTQTSDVAGAFAFAGLPAPENGKYLFKVEKSGYVPGSFASTSLSSDGTTEISMKTSAAHIAGTVTGGPASPASVSLFGTTGKVSGPIGSDALGDFRFEFETAPATPVSYTITASRPGFSGFTSITADSFDYTGVTITLTALAKQYTPTGTEPAGNIGVLDASAGGEADMTGDPGLSADVNNRFGGNAIKLVIAPQPGKGVITAALPEAGVYTVTSASPASANQWEIEGLGADGCAEIPVPFNLSDAAGIQNGSLVVWYANTSAPDDWKVAEIIGEPDYIGDGTTGLLYAKVCGWSLNLIGIGAAPAPAGSTGGSDSSGCFIHSVSGSSGAMMAWLAIAGILAAGIVLRMGRRSKSL